MWVGRCIWASALQSYLCDCLRTKGQLSVGESLIKIGIPVLFVSWNRHITDDDRLFGVCCDKLNNFYLCFSSIE